AGPRAGGEAAGVAAADVAGGAAPPHAVGPVHHAGDRGPLPDLPTALAHRVGQPLDEDPRVDETLPVEDDGGPDLLGERGLEAARLLAREEVELDILPRLGDVLELLDEHPAFLLAAVGGEERLRGVGLTGDPAVAEGVERGEGQAVDR